MTMQYRYAISHTPPHMHPVHTFTSWRPTRYDASLDMVHATEGMRVVVLNLDTYALCKPSGEPIGSAALTEREETPASKAHALEPNSSWESDDDKWRKRDRLYLEGQEGTTAYERQVQEMKEAHE